MASSSPSTDRAVPERPSNREWKRFIARTWRGRCPRCGDGTLFVSRFRLRADCEHRGLVFRREQGAMTGQMYLSAVVTEILAAALVLVIFFGTDWGPGLSIAVSVPVIILFSYWFLPRGMGLWVAVGYMTDIANREPWVDGQ
ncbi:MAG: DUF983 domain-containing protein [bacterium]|nr:DUF983 domain-containing protein [bacterium]